MPLGDGKSSARAFLLRGMLCGLIAGAMAFAFAKWYGEPQIAQAIVFETQLQHAKGEAPDRAVFSRTVQSTAGLFTAAAAIAVADGGLFGLAFAVAYGRVGTLRPRATAALIASAAFILVGIVPALKYPANPPSIGEPATIGYRTELYFSLIALSAILMILVVLIGRALEPRIGGWNASLVAGGAFIVAMFALQAVLPTIDETPADFSADLLWRFRVAAFETQLIIWATIGLVFGALTERSAAQRVNYRSRGADLGVTR